MYEYKVIEAPLPSASGWFGRKKTTYAQALSDAINELALENWEYQRAEHGPGKGSADILIFRRPIAKAGEDMGEPKSFAERMGEAGQREDAGTSYEGPVKPRRARMIVTEAGPLTERPKVLAVRPSEPQIIDGTARRVTPMKPPMAAGAAANASGASAEAANTAE